MTEWKHKEIDVSFKSNLGKQCACNDSPTLETMQKFVATSKPDATLFILVCGTLWSNRDFVIYSTEKQQEVKWVKKVKLGKDIILQTHALSGYLHIF